MSTYISKKKPVGQFEPEGKTTHDVGIYSRVLAAGINKNGTLRVTLLLTPAPTNGSTLKKIPLEQWPSKLMEEFDHHVAKVGGKPSGFSVSLKFLPVAVTNQADRPRPTPLMWSQAKPVSGIAKRLWAAYGDAKSRDRKTIDTLWQQSFVRKCEPDKDQIGKPWIALNAGLKRSFAGSAFDAGKIATGQDSTGSQINDVRSVRQTEIAVTLELIRAHELATTVREVFGEEGARRKLERDLQALSDSKLAGLDPSESTAEPKPLSEAEALKVLSDAKKLERQRNYNLLERGDKTVAKSSFDAARSVVATGKKETPSKIAPSGSLDASTLVAAPPETIHATSEAPLASHVDGTWLEQNAQTGAPGALKQSEQVIEFGVGDIKGIVNEDIERASQRFFALQSAPSLARLFCLAVDLEVDPKVVGLDVAAGGERFFFLGTEFGRLGPSDDAHVPLTMTLAKFARRPDGSVSFWPATRSEIDLRDEDKADKYKYLTQENGLMVMGHGWADANPRFEITSIDVRSAAETQEQRNRERQMLPAPDSSKDGDPQHQAMRDRPAERQTVLTAGITLLDRGREGLTAAKLATRTAQKEEREKGIVLLDADELTVGYRPDVGVFSRTSKYEKPGYQWRGLMNREVEFGASGSPEHMPAVRRLLVKLTGALGAEERTMLDSSALSTPMRLMPEVPKDGQDQGTATIVEELITVWDGGPMGIDCSGPDELKKVVDDLPIGREIRLPDSLDAASLRPPRLRFGWPYRIGMRAVYMGGASPSTAEASHSYDLGDQIAFPPGRSEGKPNEQRRFLRHERIDAPIPLLPSDIALHGDSLMGFESAGKAIVRSYTPPKNDNPATLRLVKEIQDQEADAKKRARPQRTRRIFVAPKVSQALATLHSVFDGDKRRQQPEQGLEGVRYDAEGGGFPYANPDERRGLDAILFPLSRAIGTVKSNNGEAVFQTTSASSKNRQSPYYPDPAARSFVVGLRHPVTKTFIGGQPQIVPLYETNAGYPHALPLEVNVVAIPGKRPRGVPVTHQDVIAYQDKLVWLRPERSGPQVKGRSLTLKLVEGEDFELVIWCLPSVAMLAKVFAVVETLGVLAAQNSKDKDESSVLRESDLAAVLGVIPFGGLVRTFSRLVTRVVKMYLSGQTPGDIGFVGVGGLTTPGVHGLMGVAAVLHHAMIHRPVDELAATSTMQVTHATSRPLFAPLAIAENNKAPDGKPQLQPLRIARLNLDDGKKLRTAKPDERYQLYFSGPVVDPGAADFALGGSILVDLDTSSGFEIEAVTSFPRSPKFDDEQNRRSRQDRRAGRWPVATDLTSGTKRLFSTSDIYGFYVGSDGRVELPKSAVTLMRVEAIATPQESQALTHKDELEIVNLEQIYGLEFNSNGFYFGSAQQEMKSGDQKTPPSTPRAPDFLQKAKVALPHNFPDGKARKLTLSVISLNRFGHLWQTAPRRNEMNIFQYGDPLAPGAASTRSEPVDVWLPATFRPAKPVTRTPLPLFQLKSFPRKAKDGSPGTFVCHLTRSTATRVWLRREWFSSGEGEKLGVVIWPPNLFGASANKIADDEIVFPQFSGPLSGPSDGSRRSSLNDFADLDLGPGGAYATRWGGDPIRGGGKQTSMFIPPTAFADHETRVAELVTRVSMPIGSTDTEHGRVPPEALDAGNQKGNDKPIADTLVVSLLTYEPRFDVGAEEWYVDLHITPASAPDPFVRLGLVRYQEHAPAHLQVSQPVVEWAQLLPSRDVTMEVTDTGDLNIEGYVIGQSYDSVAEETADDADEVRHRYPAMTFTLVFEAKDRDGRTTQEIVDTISTKPLGDENGKAEPDPSAKEAKPKFASIAGVGAYGSETRWYVYFRTIKSEERHKRGDGRYFVTVEEVEYRRPASYPGREPLSLDQNIAESTLVASGPRFFARLELDRD